MQSGIEEILTKKTGEIYRELLEHLSYHAPSQFIEAGYERYEENYPSNPSINGKIFEYFICEVLVQERIVPFYFQATFAHVPNADFDIVLYHPTKPVILSAKTSTRERYKQAVLEGFALKQVYRNAECHLLVRSDEYRGIRDKIENGDVPGLTSCMRADRSDFDDLINVLKKREFQFASEIRPLEGKPVTGH